MRFIAVQDAIPSRTQTPRDQFQYVGDVLLVVPAIELFLVSWFDGRPYGQDMFGEHRHCPPPAPTSSVSRADDYSITWSARSSSAGGIVRPSALAVLRLMISSNFVGCSTGRSAGLVPLRILSTYVAAC